MKLYDSLIDRLEKVTEKMTPAVFSYEENRLWPENADYEAVLRRDAGLELGNLAHPSVNYTCITSRKDYFSSDQVRIYGPDLPALGSSSDFARVSEVVIEEDMDREEDTDRLYRLIQDIDFVKYHVYPKGYMVRTSGQSPREQVRVSKKALADGISLSAVGNTYIHHYLLNPAVKCVRISFFTAADVDYAALQDSASVASQIRNSLSGILKGLPKDCPSCGIKEICGSIEGLKELHFGKKTG